MREATLPAKSVSTLSKEDGDPNGLSLGVSLEGADRKLSDPTRILVVEDSADHSELLLRQLRKAHLDSHVKIIADGKEAWDFLSRECRCDELIAIFLDLHLPSLNGVQLLRLIRANEQLAAVPVIVISSSDNPAEHEQCRALKVSAIVAKPVSFSTFSKTVADVFHSTETQRLVRPE